MVLKTNPPMKAILPKKTFNNPINMKSIANIMKTPINKASIPKINSIIILSFFIHI